MHNDNPYIVSVEWLHQHLDAPDIRIIDASWYLNAPGRDPISQFEAAHIPGAVFFDQEEVVDKTSPLPHTIPSPQDFAAHIGRLGISEKDRIIVYEREGYFAAPRVWWLFRLMGAARVYVLDGGARGWADAGLPLTNAPTSIKPVIFNPNFQAQDVVTLAEMRQIVESGQVQIVDARGAGRFLGHEAEPRPNMRSGHMPGAYNVPYPRLVHNGYLKSPDALRQVFEQAGIDVAAPVVTSCGSGVTAAILTLALQALGNRSVRLYDGSWSEWGSLTDTPIAQGYSERT